MFVVTVIFTCHDGAGAAFKPLVARQAHLSMTEEEKCRQFDVAQHDQFPDTFFLYELYDDKDAFDAHLKTNHYNDFDDKIKPLVKDKIVRVYNQLMQG